MSGVMDRLKADEAWMCDLISRLGDIARHSPHSETIIHAQSALIQGHSGWRDSAALNYLASKRPGGWCVRLDGKDVGTGDGPRAAMFDAILRLEGAIQ